jgi:hypothetical protein
MAQWSDVERVAVALPGTSKGAAHEGSPAILVGKNQFARLRVTDEGGEILQFWVADEDLVQGYVDLDPATYRGARGYSRKVVMATLDRLDVEVLGELLVESWAARAPATLRRQHPAVAKAQARRPPEA